MFCDRSCRTASRQKMASSPYQEVRFDGKRTYAHRATMQKILGRPLQFLEIVHHKDHNGWNNDPSNLVVLSPKQHAEEHIKIKWIEKAKSLAERGITAGDIARQIGVSYRSVWDALKRRGIKTVRRKPQSKIDIQQAKKMHKRGLSLREIGRRLGYSHGAIKAVIEK